FAAVIQESGRGLVIGRQTCGCFTSSYFESVKGEGRLQWSRVLPRTIKGRKIEGEGVIPDKMIPINLSPLRQGRDTVLEEAERILRSQLQAPGRISMPRLTMASSGAPSASLRSPADARREASPHCAHTSATEIFLEPTMFKETHPIIGTRDIQRAIDFYTQQLGFNL